MLSLFAAARQLHFLSIENINIVSSFKYWYMPTTQVAEASGRLKSYGNIEITVYVFAMKYLFGNLCKKC